MKRLSILIMMALVVAFTFTSVCAKELDDTSEILDWGMEDQDVDLPDGVYGWTPKGGRYRTYHSLNVNTVLWFEMKDKTAVYAITLQEQIKYRLHTTFYYWDDRRDENIYKKKKNFEHTLHIKGDSNTKNIYTPIDLTISHHQIRGLDNFYYGVQILRIEKNGETIWEND